MSESLTTWELGKAYGKDLERERIIQLLDSLNKHAHYKADFIIRLINKDGQTQ